MSSLLEYELVHAFIARTSFSTSFFYHINEETYNPDYINFIVNKKEQSLRIGEKARHKGAFKISKKSPLTARRAQPQSKQPTSTSFHSVLVLLVHRNSKFLAQGNQRLLVHKIRDFIAPQKLAFVGCGDFLNRALGIRKVFI